MRYVLLSILLIAFIYMGKSISNYYRNRERLYNNIKEMIKKIKLSMSFEKSNMIDNIKKMKYKDSDTIVMIEKYRQYLTTGEEIEIESIKILSNDEKSQICEMLTSFGKSDTDTEREKLNNYESIIENKIESVSADVKKYCPVATKLSLLIGLIIVILLI